jgi:hypothetical protein
MKRTKMLTILALGLMVCLVPKVEAEPMGTAWTYQGRLMDANFPADGLYDFLFVLFDGPEGPGELSAQVIHNMDVIDGYFTVDLDYGSDVFDGSERWLQIEIRPGELDDPNEYTLLNPRQRITPMPYALQTRGIFVNSAGQVGIGTKNPQARLSLGAEIPPTPKKLAVWDGIEDFYGFGADWGRMTVYANNEEKMTVTDTGNVGIGTIAPGQKLDIDGGNIVVQGTESFDSAGEEGVVYLGSVHHYIKGVFGFGVKLGTYVAGDVLSIKEISGNVGIGTTTPVRKLDVVGEARFDGALYARDTTGIGLKDDAGNLGLWVRNSGNVGIGTTNPSQKLDVDNGDIVIQGPDSFDAAGEQGSVYLGSVHNYVRGEYGFGVKIGAYAAGDALSIREVSGNVGIGTTTPTEKLTIRGNLLIERSDGTDVVELGEGLDYAEGFDVSESSKIDAGSVLIIDSTNPGKLALSNKPYDTKVAGIVAGANGLGSGVRLGAGGFDHDVALAGRVYCKVDATEAGVEAGDLLTTCATPGYAMKAADHTRAQGAILGKAMESLEKGQTGQILVLVTLQ